MTLTVSLIQLFEYAEYRRTNCRVLQVQIQDGMLPIAQRVRIIGAGSRPEIIDPAFVVGLQERAGRPVEHEIAVFVHDEERGDETTRGHLEPGRDPVDVLLPDQCRSGLAASRAVQAVDRGKLPFVLRMDGRIQVLLWYPLQTGDQLFIGFPGTGGQGAQFLETDTCYRLWIIQWAEL